MNEAIYEDELLITLNGRITRFLGKTHARVLFEFDDKVHGSLLLVAYSDSILYYRVEVNKAYTLKVALKGFRTTKPDGTLFTNNALVVRKCESA
jgi:hypothetical protein